MKATTHANQQVVTPKLMPSEYNSHFFSYSMCSLLLMHLGILNGTVKLHFDLSQLVHVIGHLTVLIHQYIQIIPMCHPQNIQQIALQIRSNNIVRKK